MTPCAESLHRNLSASRGFSAIAEILPFYKRSGWNLQSLEGMCTADGEGCAWCRCAGNLCLSPRVSTAPSNWLTSPRLTTFTSCLNDAQDGGGSRHDYYKRLSSSGYDVCFSTPSHSSCVVVDQSSNQSTCHEIHESQINARLGLPGHYERLQLNTGVSGGSLERQRRRQLISQNHVTSLVHLRTSTSQSGVNDVDDVSTDEVD